MNRRWHALLTVCCAAALCVAATDADRTTVYQEFRLLFDAHRYGEALPVAEKLVSMTEEQYGANDRQLVNPLTNVGTLHHRLGEHAAAEQSYLRSVRILEANGGPLDRQLLLPLQGLGVTYLALGQYQDAALILKRAADLARNLNGLFNPGQLAILKPLIDSYVALGRNADAEQEIRYTLRIAEMAYGKDDPHLLDPLNRLALWYESVGRYTSARALHARALTIVEEKIGRENIKDVEPLRGIARTYRLELTYGTEPSNDSASAAIPIAESGSSELASRAPRANPQGEQALLAAIDVLRRANPPEAAQHGATLADLGDWYLVTGNTVKAMASYREAWQELEKAGSTKLLSEPRQLSYHAPPASVARSKLSRADAVEQHVQVRFTVTRDGKITNVAPVSTDASESLAKSVVNAVRRARYAPRMREGESVDAPGITLEERLLVKR